MYGRSSAIKNFSILIGIIDQNTDILPSIYFINLIYIHINIYIHTYIYTYEYTYIYIQYNRNTFMCYYT